MPLIIEKHEWTTEDKEKHEKRREERLNEIEEKRKKERREIEFGKTLLQKSDGIYSVKNEQLTLLGRIYIHQIIIIRDELELFEPVYSINYHDLIYDKEKFVENKTFDELIKYIHEQKLFIGDNKKIKNIIETIIQHKYIDKMMIEKQIKVFKEGFFIKDGKVIENSLITGLKPTKEEIKESIQLVNQLLEDRGTAIENDCTVFRFMLWSPFSWCLKEISKTNGLYGLILIGKKQTSKTGSCLNFSWLYSTADDREKAVSTTSVFGSRLEESSLPAIIDEAYTLISREDMQDPMKRCIYNKDTRSTKDKNNPQSTIKYLALSLPIFTMNEYEDFKDFMTRRYHINYYSPDMVVDDEDAEKFNNKYSPVSEDSPLVALRYLGRAFADKFIPYIESNSEKLFNLEKLTVKILKEIAKEVGEEFNASVYNIQKSADNFDQDICATIRSGLNKLFRKNHYKNPSENYGLYDFVNCANNGEINWLYYRNKQQTFVINKKGFEKEVSQIIGENMDYESILTELKVDMANITYSDNAIHTNRGNTRGFGITADELIKNVFDMHISSVLYSAETNEEDTKDK